MTRIAACSYLCAFGIILASGDRPLPIVPLALALAIALVFSLAATNRKDPS